MVGVSQIFHQKHHQYPPSPISPQCQGWVNGASQFLVDIGHRANDCKTADDVSLLIKELVEFKDQGTKQQNERLDSMECIATELYGRWCGVYVEGECVIIW